METAVTLAREREMTQVDFIKAYMAELKARYPWTSDLAKFAKFMQGVTLTLRVGGNQWVAEGEAVKAAWKSIGGKGNPSLQKLRDLPLN